MYYLRNQPWSTPDAAEVAGDVHWNLWTVRQRPYQLLEAGDRMLLCTPVGRGSRITWEVEITKVERAAYLSKREAWKVIDAAFPQLRGNGMTFARFRDNGYTQRGPEAGHLLALSYDPVQELQVDRPSGWKLHRNGWLALDVAEAERLTGADVTAAKNREPRRAVGTRA